MTPAEIPAALEPLLALRQHRRNGERSPHKPLLVLLALGQYAATSSSALSWDSTAGMLADLIAQFGPPSKTGAAQSAAYPYTRLRSDGVWHLDRDVPMDLVGPLRAAPITGRFAPRLEQALSDPATLNRVARTLVQAEFPETLVPDVLAAAGLDPEAVLAADTVRSPADTRRRSSSWPSQVLAAWDRRCAFCGYDGQLGAATVGIEAAHVRWFNFDGPDDMDNGLALCSLDHKLFDRGVLGITPGYTILVSRHFSARTDAGRRVYDRHERKVSPRPGTLLPARDHVDWHTSQVFKGPSLTG